MAPVARAGVVDLGTHVEHEDMNILLLRSRVVGVELAREVVRAFLQAGFTGEERHQRRLGKVKAVEARA